MLIDTHCHLDFKQFDSDRRQVIQRAFSNEVASIINVNADAYSAFDTQRISEDYPGIFFTIGHHPHYADKFNRDILKEIQPLLSDKKLVAVGEVGLDYYRNLSKRQEQIKVFEEFIALSKELSLPLIIHYRGSHDDTFDILSGQLSNFDSVVFHCFSGNRQFLEKCLAKGAKFSFTGNITYPNAVSLRSIIIDIPIENIMVETDAPFLPPQKMRGKRNEPSFVHFVAQEIGKIKGVSFEEACERTSENAKEFFKIG